MKLSVIVPVYNVEPYIRRCIDSIINQTYRNLEIILVDDGSTDGSGEICDEYALMDERVQVIHKVNEGIVSARQAGIQCTTGEYATNVDSDDWIEENAYKYMVEKLEKYHPDILALGYKKEYTGFTEQYRQILQDGFYLREKFWNSFNDCVKSMGFFCQPIDMSLWNKVIKTELWKKHQMACTNDLRKNVDDAVVFPCLLDVDSIYVDSKCFYHYCVRKTSILWGSRREDYQLFLNLAKCLITAYQNSSNRNYMNKEFLLYKLFYHMFLDTPEMIFRENQCMIYPKIRVNSKVVVYGKGVFASRLIDLVKKIHFFDIVANLDKTDIDRIMQMDVEAYDYIIIAILNYAMAESAVAFLLERGVCRDKILCIEKQNLTIDILPEDIKCMWVY